MSRGRILLEVGMVASVLDRRNRVSRRLAGDKNSRVVGWCMKEMTFAKDVEEARRAAGTDQRSLWQGNGQKTILWIVMAAAFLVAKPSN